VILHYVPLFPTVCSENAVQLYECSQNAVQLTSAARTQCNSTPSTLLQADELCFRWTCPNGSQQLASYLCRMRAHCSPSRLVRTEATQQRKCRCRTFSWSMSGACLVLSDAVDFLKICSQSVVAPIRASRGGERQSPFMFWVTCQLMIPLRQAQRKSAWQIRRLRKC
jgi:hypothetical protein